MKKISFILILILVFICSSLIVFATSEPNIPEPTKDFFVNDFANVISEKDEQIIMKKAEELYKNTGNSTQVVAVTVNSLDGYSIEEYANKLFNTWGIGSKEENDGLLILLAVKERESRIEVGYGLEGILNDAKTGRIQDKYMIPYYKNNDFSTGLVKGVETSCDVISGNLDFEKIDEKNETIFNVTIMVIHICACILFWILRKKYIEYPRGIRSKLYGFILICSFISSFLVFAVALLYNNLLGGIVLIIEWIINILLYFKLFKVKRGRAFVTLFCGINFFICAILILLGYESSTITFLFLDYFIFRFIWLIYNLFDFDGNGSYSGTSSGHGYSSGYSSSSHSSSSSSSHYSGGGGRSGGGGSSRRF